MRLVSSLIAILLCAAPLALLGADHDRGWALFSKARSAAGASAANLHDAELRLVTRTQSKQGEVTLRSTSRFVVPNIIRQEIQTPQGGVTVIFDGFRGWRLMGDNVQFMPQKFVNQISADLARQYLLFSAEVQPSNVRYVGSGDADGAPVEIIEVNNVGGTLVEVALDPATHDVLRLRFEGNTPAGPAEVEERWSDYRAVGDFRWPFQRTVLRGGKFASETVAMDVQFNTGLTKQDLLD